MLDLYKSSFQRIEIFFGKIFSFLALSPHQYTLLSLVFALGGFYFLLKQNLILGILFFFIASILDFIDGAVARAKKIATKFGAYLDTIVDRYVEGIFLFGLLFLPLPEVFLPSFFWIFLIFFGSMMTTYTKAAAKEKDLVNQELRGGLLSRTERMILLLVSLILGIFNFSWMTYFLILIAILTNLTAFERIILALKSIS